MNSFDYSFRKIEIEVNCKSDYFHIYADYLTFKTVALSFLVLVLSIAVELIVHSPTINLFREPPQAQEVEAPPLETSDGSETRTYYVTPPEKPVIWWDPNPSPSARAYRLAVATVLFVPLCIAFGFRAAEFPPPYVSPQCIQYFTGYLYPNWWVVVPLTIIPFAIGCSAWLRALVNCLLVRWGKRVGYLGDKGGIEWPVCAPIVLPFVLLTRLLRLIAAAIMGGTGKEMKRAENIELGEEAMGLVAGVDGAEDDGYELPPSYESSLGNGKLRENSSDV